MIYLIPECLIGNKCLKRWSRMNYKNRSYLLFNLILLNHLKIHQTILFYPSLHHQCNPCQFQKNNLKKLKLHLLGCSVSGNKYQETNKTWIINLTEINLNIVISTIKMKDKFRDNIKLSKLSTLIIVFHY